MIKLTEDASTGDKSIWVNPRHIVALRDNCLSGERVNTQVVMRDGFVLFVKEQMDYIVRLSEELGNG